MNSAPEASRQPGRETSPDPAELDRIVAWTVRDRLRLLWYGLLREVSDCHYAARRMVELQLRLPE